MVLRLYHNLEIELNLIRLAPPLILAQPIKATSESAEISEAQKTVLIG